MSNTNSGPQTTESESMPANAVAGFPGDLRDWFAGQALAAIIPVCEDPVIPDEELTNSEIEIPRLACARVAYKFADAMLAERKRGDDAKD